MSLSSLKAELDGYTGNFLMPGRWLTESLIAWCRAVAKHNVGELESSEDNDLFEVVNSFIEKLLLAQDVERYDFYRKNRTTLFLPLAHEFDGIVSGELIARQTRYGIDRVTLNDLFHEHFPESLKMKQPDQRAGQSDSTAVHTGPAQ